MSLCSVKWSPMAISIGSGAVIENAGSKMSGMNKRKMMGYFNGQNLKSDSVLEGFVENLCLCVRSSGRRWPFQ